MGPTNPMPGPIFPKVAATAPAEDSKSIPSNEIIILPSINTRIYNIKKLVIPATVSFGSTLSLVFIGIIALG